VAATDHQSVLPTSTKGTASSLGATRSSVDRLGLVRAARVIRARACTGQLSRVDDIDRRRTRRLSGAASTGAEPRRAASATAAASLAHAARSQARPRTAALAPVPSHQPVSQPRRQLAVPGQVGHPRRALSHSAQPSVPAPHSTRPPVRRTCPKQDPHGTVGTVVGAARDSLTSQDQAGARGVVSVHDPPRTPGRCTDAPNEAPVPIMAVEVVFCFTAHRGRPSFPARHAGRRRSP
jgi:hypothetical protein